MTSIQSQKDKKQSNINKINFTKYFPSYFDLLFIVVTISVCFIAHMRHEMFLD